LISGQPRINTEQQQALGIKPGIQVLEVAESSHKQAGRYQYYDRQCHLYDYENASRVEPPLPSLRPKSKPALTGLHPRGQANSRAAQGRSQPEDDAAQQANPAAKR